jgi:4-hydroxyphenylacetate 3-monooxygenase oxygenase component
MAPRNGQEFVEGLRRAPREVWIAGRRVGEITADPVFQRPIRSIAQLYDLQTRPEHGEVMTCEEGDERFGTSFMIPRTSADLVKRRESMKVWADASFGMVGRSPDYLNTVLMTWAEGADFFGQRGAQFARNVTDYYQYCRSRDLFLTHAIVNPQTDRSKGSHQHEDAFAHLGVVEETRDGLIVRGAKMLATHGPTADELLVYPLPGIREGEERYVLAFGIPVSTPGLRFICREPFDSGTQSEWDHPLGARFEEPDAVCVFNDVLIPWERVFLYNDVKMGNALFAQASIRNHTGHQTAIRGLAKCQLVTGIAIAMTRTVKSDGFLHVQEQLGELLGYLQLIEAAILMSEQKAEPTGRGALRPAYAPLQALRYHLPKMYERMVQVTQVLGAGGLLINPMEADLHSEIGPDIARYYRGAGVDADKRIQLYKLAWDITGTQFGQRMLQYERYYAGDPVRVGASYYLGHDVDHLLAQVQRALKGSSQSS